MLTTNVPCFYNMRKCWEPFLHQSTSYKVPHKLACVRAKCHPSGIESGYLEGERLTHYQLRTCFYNMRECWEPFLHPLATGSEDHNCGQVDVPHEGPAYDACLLVIAKHMGSYVVYHAVWPWDSFELSPPPV